MIFLCVGLLAMAQDGVERYGVWETSHRAGGSYGNPYTVVTADATIIRPGGEKRTIPLF